MCASKTYGYQGFKSFAVQHCATLKPGETYEQRATKFSSMGSHIIAPPTMNRMGRHAHESVAMQNGQQVQPEDYRVPDRRGVSVNQKRPDAKPFIASSTYLHDFRAFDDERTRVLHVPLEEYERAFMAVASSNDQQREEATIQLHQVQDVLKLALGDAAVPRVLEVFHSYLDRRGSVRDRISWGLFRQAIDHVDELFAHELSRCKTADTSGKAWGSGTFAEKQLSENLVHSSTPASSYQKDFGTYGENPRDRPYMRMRGMASTTTDLNPGTSSVTNQIPGYAGFVPLTSHSAEAVAQANGPEQIEGLRPTPRVALRLFHSDNIPGYTGHKPVECVNYRGECRAGSDPGTTTGESYNPHK
ncbi:ATPase, P-type (transporting), HAD super, sub IC [Phytophthora pseudosyringae]|uniref:ATPase, P-type (Transporting), HAD super, sub IC n=1 Tax=Phytophthora pseudosyringae TaxID=221518 RepID=A0A8T1W6I7_9STRA|nr:ATPase, P-type (transporting), HAD super, sub IC [Phytophthora pseudosyringae]